MWTKRQLVMQAFRKAGLASYIFNLQPDQLQSALYDMDSMMATWAQKGILLGYVQPTSQAGTDLNQESGLQTVSNEAVYSNLALRISGDFGKVAPLDTRLTASLAYGALCRTAAFPAPVQMPGNMPLGAGNMEWNGNRMYPFVAPPDLTSVNVGLNGDLVIGNSQ